jgi:hypothetical protein
MSSNLVLNTADGILTGQIITHPTGMRISMAEIKTKQSFGTAKISHISPAIGTDAPRAMNVHLTFEEALKLYFGLSQLLAKLNSYKRSTTAGRRSAANLCIYPHTGRITLNEGKLREPAETEPEELGDVT